MIAQVANKVDGQKMSYQQATKKWINDNFETWSKWIPAHCRKGLTPN
jgi:ABC-type proline/glycine betaine transport system substrate-binding protein